MADGGQMMVDEEPAQASHEPLSVRVARLEEQVAAVVNELRELKAKLGE
jgi:chaperonin cofactor prefoldin